MSLWLSFLKIFNGRALFVGDQIVTNHDINLYTYASGSLGYGRCLVMNGLAAFGQIGGRGKI